MEAPDEADLGVLNEHQQAALASLDGRTHTNGLIDSLPRAMADVADSQMIETGYEVQY